MLPLFQLANISGQPFPVNFNDIDKNIGSAVDLMLNFIESTGIPSTIIEFDETENSIPQVIT